MIITYSNYKTVLPEIEWETFRRMAGRSKGQKIIWANGVLQYEKNTKI